MTIKERVQNLRKLMKAKGIDAYIIPSADDHQSEYVAEHFKCRQWISGFTGSAGTVVVTLDEAGLWTDGRYFIQAEKQLRNSEIKLFKMGEPEVPTYMEFIKNSLHYGNTVGFDGKLFSHSDYLKMNKLFSRKGIKINTDYDLIDKLWVDRPSIPKGDVFIHDLKFAGKPRTEKLNEIRKEMKDKGADVYLLTQLDDIAWLYNLRGSDVPI
ncbi:MAG TPA: peptidase M24, partial [Clostridiaceae bacterium]|nr:peptidase M24 [Clostridiaceae bacterium]HCL49795.1 peptidase M24 [Clostridiaceae bacterium]